MSGSDDLHERERRLADAGLGVRKGLRASVTATLKKVLRRSLGDNSTATVHAVRFVLNNRRGVYIQHDAGLNYIDKFLEPGDVFIDVGANGADWAYEGSRIVGPRGHVYSFEAHPYYAKVTGKAIRMLGLANVTFFPFGLSDRREQTALLETNERGEQVAGTGFVVRDGKNNNQLAAIELHRLDDMVAEHASMKKVAFIKLDVEGFELMVVRGAAQLIANARPVVIAEVGAAYLHGLGEHELFDFFFERDYRCFALGPDKVLLPSKDHTGTVRPYHVDRVFIPSEKVSHYQSMIDAGTRAR